MPWCSLVQRLVVAKHGRGTVEWNTHLPQLVSNAFNHVNCTLQRTELRAERQHLNFILSFGIPHDRSPIHKYEHTCMQAPRGLAASMICSSKDRCDDTVPLLLRYILVRDCFLSIRVKLTLVTDLESVFVKNRLRVFKNHLGLLVMF